MYGFIIDMVYSNYLYESRVHESAAQTSAGEVDNKLWLPAALFSCLPSLQVR